MVCGMEKLGKAIMAVGCSIRRFRLRIFAAALVASICSLGLILLAESVISQQSSNAMFDEVERVPEREAALVLGCSQYLSDGRANLFFKYRIEKAHELYAAGKVRFLIVSGDNHRSDYDEPTDMKQALVRLGVPEERIFCDYAGFSTLDSVVRAKEIFGQERLIVVSQAFHNRRAIFIGRSKGMALLGVNARDVSAYFGLKTRLREQLAKVKTVLDVWLLGREPRFLGPKIELASK